MMPIEFPESKWFGKPKNMTDEECSGIYCKPGNMPSREETWKWFGNSVDGVSDKLQRIPQTTEELSELLKSFFFEVLKQVKPVHFFGIPAMAGTDKWQFPYYLTAWKPNKEDIEAINRGEPVYIKSISTGLHPMAVFTVDEKGELN